jgi:hypothetical protein
MTGRQFTIGLLLVILVAIGSSLLTTVLAADQLDLRGPRGATGPQGERGPRGHTGRQGSAGAAAADVAAPASTPDEQTLERVDRLRDAACVSLQAAVDVETSPTRARRATRAALNLGCTIVYDGG